MTRLCAVVDRQKSIASNAWDADGRSARWLASRSATMNASSSDWLRFSRGSHAVS